MQADGHAVDKKYPNIKYVPNDSFFDLNTQKISWDKGSIPISENSHYVLANGYKISLEKHPYTDSWRLVGTEAEGTHSATNPALSQEAENLKSQISVQCNLCGSSFC